MGKNRIFLKKKINSLKYFASKNLKNKKWLKILKKITFYKEFPYLWKRKEFENNLKHFNVNY